MTKKEISVEIASISLYDLEVSIDTAVKTLLEAEKRYSKLPEVTRIQLSKSSHAYSDSEYLAIMASRLETDAEYDKRIKEEKELQVYQDARDAKEYERLSKKFTKGK